MRRDTLMSWEHESREAFLPLELQCLRRHSKHDRTKINKVKETLNPDSLSLGTQGFVTVPGSHLKNAVSSDSQPPFTFINHHYHSSWGAFGPSGQVQICLCSLIGPLSIGVATCDKIQIFRQKVVVVVVVASVSDVQTPLLAVPVGERDGDGVAFVSLWFWHFLAVSVWVCTAMLHIWRSTLINHVLCIFWQFPQISAVTRGLGCHLFQLYTESWPPPRRRDGFLPECDCN